uniref:Four and a half LIM domains 2 n=1 Tax=Anas platyrhynchos platyrhynchos TaxID=8840 RepID=A0A493TBM6_ANAPP
MAGRCAPHPFVNGRDPLPLLREVTLAARCCSANTVDGLCTGKTGSHQHHISSFYVNSWTPDTNMTERFDCHYCKESLFGKKYILREDSPYCVKCYENLYSNTCEECKKPIGADCKVRQSCVSSWKSWQSNILPHSCKHIPHSTQKC